MLFEIYRYLTKDFISDNMGFTNRIYEGGGDAYYEEFIGAEPGPNCFFIVTAVDANGERNFE